MESSPERCLSGLSASDGVRRCLDLDPTLGSLNLDLDLEFELELELGLRLEDNLRPRLGSRLRQHLPQSIVGWFFSSPTQVYF